MIQISSCRARLHSALVQIVLALAVIIVPCTALALPDLTPIASAANPYTTTEDYYTTSCAVDEGCTSAGTRRLLRFAAYTQNVGASDLVIGNPVGNPLFEFHACHGHYHFHDYLTIRLLTTTGTVVNGRKQSFCILDSVRHNTSAPVSPLYNCLNQGMQAGWGDVYSAGLDCQYIDITGVQPGTYVLELHVNPEETFVESNYANNVSTTTVVIPALEPIPPNDLCANASTVSIVGVPFTGNTASATNDGNATCGSSSSARDVWFRYTPGSSGSATFALCTSGYDTVLSIHSGCPGTTANQLACNDDSTGVGCNGSQQSEISMSVNSGTTYYVRVAGFQTANGSYRLVVSGPGAVSAVQEWTDYE